MVGQFFWYDLMSTDTAAAGKFYGAVVGWSTQDSGTPGPEYTLFTVAGRRVAGLMPIPDDAREAGVRPSWMGYVGVDDLVRAVARLEQAGGKLHRGPTEVTAVIRFAVVSDPQGAGFLIAQPLVKAPPEPPLGTPGTVGWRELYADDWKSAFAFYESMFGWTKTEAMDMGPMGTYQMFATGGATVGGMMNKTPQLQSPCWGYYINVAGIDAAAGRVVAGGGAVVNGPQQVPGGQWIIQCVDP